VNRPTRVVFTAHGEEKAHRFSRSLDAIANLVLTNHERRQRNPGEADWVVTGGGLVIVYNWPDGDDETAARVVSLWGGR